MFTESMARCLQARRRYNLLSSYLLQHFSTSVFVLLLFHFNGFAEPFHYQNVLQGEAAAGMGGAFTALADDSSACFYNPAGLTQITNTTFSLSATAGEISSYTIEDVIPGGKDLKTTTAAFYPTSWSITRRFKKHALGFSVIVRDNSDQELSFRDTITIPAVSDEFNVIYDVKTQSREYLIGPSYAYPFTDSFSLGFSLFLFYKTALNTGFVYLENASTGEYYGASNFNNEKSLGLSINAGLHYRIFSRWALGVNLKSGGVFTDIKKTSEVRYENTISGGEKNEVLPISEATYKYGEPPGVTLGIGYKGKTWRFGIDYTHIFKIDGLIPVENLNIGAERIFWNKMPLRFGFYTNNTSLASHKVDTTPEPDRVNFAGLTFGLGYLTEHTSTSLTFITKSGRGTSKAISESGPEFFDVSAGGLIVNFGGSYWF
jgi:long-chain fatty acid transport protein